MDGNINMNNPFLKQNISSSLTKRYFARMSKPQKPQSVKNFESGFTRLWLIVIHKLIE